MPSQPCVEHVCATYVEGRVVCLFLCRPAEKAKEDTNAGSLGDIAASVAVETETSSPGGVEETDEVRPSPVPACVSLLRMRHRLKTSFGKASVQASSREASFLSGNRSVSCPASICLRNA